MGVQFGNYILERWIAQGGMANIFLATYTGPLGFEREVVLKVILPEYAHHSSFISMFLDEARLSGRLNHSNIVQVHELGQVQGYIYLAMEYVNGPSLSRLLKRLQRENRVLSPGLAIFIVSELLEALAYAHARRDPGGRSMGIVHRDVNPQNLLLSFDGQIKLTDFGVAKANVNLHDSQAGVIKGKYSHMAPEQCLTRPVDCRADVFAAGIILHELLTGQPLFTRPTAYEMMKAVVEEPIPTPSQISARSPRELDLVTMKALARNQEDRFPTAMAFLDALNMLARQLKMVEGKHELRSLMNIAYHRGRQNLAGEQEPGVPVTEDRISQILKGLKHERDSVLRSNPTGTSIKEVPTRLLKNDAQTSNPSEPGRSRTPPPQDTPQGPRVPPSGLKEEGTNFWGELDVDG